MTDDAPGSVAPLLVVAAALVDGSGRVLVQQRPAGRDHAGLWEFPGGKVDEGETLRAALTRELAEELGIVTDAEKLEPLGFATVRAGQRELVLLLFGCRRWQGEPRPLHAATTRWVDIDSLTMLAMPPVDVALLPTAVTFMVRDGTPQQRE